MDYIRKQQVSNELLKSGYLENPEETVIRQLIIDLMRDILQDIPLSHLKDVFNVKVLNPNMSEEDYEKLTKYDKLIVDKLRNFNVIEYSVCFNPAVDTIINPNKP